MSHTLAPADASHYYQRLAELSTLPFWQREESTEPAGPEHGHVWHWQDVYPELARSRQFAADAASLQRRALILRNPGLTPPAVGATPTIAAAYQMLFPGESAPVHAHSIAAIRFGLAGSGARMIIDGDHMPMEPGDLILTPSWSWHGHVHPGGGSRGIPDTAPSPAWNTATRSPAAPPLPPWAACSRACLPKAGPGRAGRPLARSLSWRAGAGH